jgi:hypothetical protein
MKDEFPQLPEHRRLIVVLDEDEYGRCSYDADGTELLRSPETWVTPFPLSDRVRRDTLVQQLLAAGKLNPGAVLLQSPFSSDEYEPVEDAPERYAVRKHFIFTELCRRLGAKSVSVAVVESNTKEGNTEVQVSGGKLKMGAEIRGKHARLADLASSLKLTEQYVGGDADRNGAQALLESVQLTTDPVLTSLVDARSNGSNLMRQRTYTVEVTRETTARLEVLAKVKVPLFVHVTGDLKRLSREKETFRVTYEVNF